MELAQRHHSFAVALLVESHCHAEPFGVVGIGRAIVHDDPFVRYDFQKAHMVFKALWFAFERADHVEPPHPAFADVGLLGFDIKAFWAIPFRQRVGVRPGSEDLVAWMVQQLCQHDLAVQRPSLNRIFHVVHPLRLCGPDEVPAGLTVRSSADAPPPSRLPPR